MDDYSYHFEIKIFYMVIEKSLDIFSYRCLIKYLVSIIINYLQSRIFFFWKKGH